MVGEGGIDLTQYPWHVLFFVKT